MTDAAATPTPAQLVVNVGQALYGAEWQSPFARDLGVNLRTMQRVAAAARDGDDYSSAKAWIADLLPIIDARLGALITLRNQAAELA